jgi:Concanavalin A-like lectin/glucanases superfamily
VKATTLLSAIILSLLFVPSVPAIGPEGGGAEPQLALLYDFQAVEGAQIPDGSGHGHTGTLEAGEIVFGRNKPAVQFAGKGLVTMNQASGSLDPASRALTVGAMCKPGAPDGVIVSMGDAKDGFSLYLQGGVPHFAVRANGVLHEVAAPDTVELDQWVHVAGVIDRKGELALLVDAFPVAQGQGSLVAHTPDEPLSVGADAGSLVGDYRAPLYWQGLIQDVRLYWGAVSREANRNLLSEWGNRPGCGVHK